MTDLDRLRWARALNFAGWLCVSAYLFFIVWQIRRAFAIKEASFEDGLWWQRIEQMSFLALPQNLMVLVPAAAAAAIGTVLVRDLVDRVALSLSLLTRIVAGVAYVVIAIGTLGIIGIFFRNPDSIGDLASFILRLGGVMIAVAIIRICLETEATTSAHDVS